MNLKEQDACFRGSLVLHLPSWAPLDAKVRLSHTCLAWPRHTALPLTLSSSTFLRVHIRWPLRSRGYLVVRCRQGTSCTASAYHLSPHTFVTLSSSLFFLYSVPPSFAWLRGTTALSHHRNGRLSAAHYKTSNTLWSCPILHVARFLPFRHALRLGAH